MVYKTLPFLKSSGRDTNFWEIEGMSVPQRIPSKGKNLSSDTTDGVKERQVYRVQQKERRTADSITSNDTRDTSEAKISKVKIPGA